MTAFRRGAWCFGNVGMIHAAPWRRTRGVVEDASGLLPSQQPLVIEMAFFQIRKRKVAARRHHCVQREREDHRRR